MSAAFTTPPSLDDLEAIGRKALESVPAKLRRHVRNVVIRVDEFPDEETEKAMQLESPYDILGLYRGISLAHKSVAYPPRGPDMIFLYRRPILDYWCETGEDLFELVRHVLIHEIGHYFGLSDDDMAHLEK